MSLTSVGTRVRSIVVAFVLAMFAAVTFAMAANSSSAHAHDILVDRGVETTSSGSIESIRLSFNNTPLEVGNEAYVRDADGNEMTNGPLTVDGRDVHIPLVTDLAAGDYSGAWRVTSSDGHPIQGAFTLTVTADGTATLADAEFSTPSDTEESPDGDAMSPDSSESGLPTTAIVIGAVVVVAALGTWAAVATKRKRSR